MKKTLTTILILVATAGSAFAQNVNWSSMREDQQNIVQFNFGYDFGATAQLSFGRIFDIVRPVFVGLDYSFPMGSDVFDDFKVQLGAKIQAVEIDGFSATVKIMSHFRRFENDFVRIASFGSDFGVVAGYYSPTWYAAGEFGFDKSITSNLKHSALMREYFPAIQDGWYIPSGGNYYYGVQGGKTIGETLELSLRLGATEAQANDEDPVLPYYAQLGLGVKF